MASAELPMYLSFQGVNEFWDALASLALARFLCGDEPFVELLELRGVIRSDDLVPIGSVAWKVAGRDSDKLLAQGDGWSVYVDRGRNGVADVSVTATGREALAKVAADVRSRAPVVDEPTPDTVPVEFWYHGSCTNPRHVDRRIDAPAWDDVSAHYPATVRDQLDTLMGLGPPGAGGRLMLWHGPPGTGKTSAIRALARAWAGWCRTLFVIDPERFLGDANYLMSVLLGADDHDDAEEGARWRLLVVEDADELLRADAKREAGQSLSRLLNVSDGLIGQGVNILLLLTTNEPLGRLHPAVVRPGRCLADVEFRALAGAEASALLGPGQPCGGDLTLAEVFERRGGVSRVGARAAAERVGQYL